MDAKDIRNLMEAYSEVYAPQEEIDEAEKPFPHEKVKAKQVALRSQGGNALERRMKMGAAVRRAKEAEKTGGSQQTAGAGWYHAKEEVDIFDIVLEFLQAEGFAETLEEAEWLMANMIDEEAIGIILGEEQLDEISDRRVQGMLAKREKQDRDSGGISAGYMANRRAQQAAARRNVRTGSKVKVDPILSKEEYELDEGHGSRTSFKTQSKDERWRVKTFGSNYTPHKNYDPEANRGQGQILRPNQAEKQRRKKLAKSAMGEEYMDEAQVANRDPEKYEREQSKKYAPVRGERTPMPPRGDKRREDFEKWYAKQMGR